MKDATSVKADSVLIPPHIKANFSLRVITPVGSAIHRARHYKIRYSIYSYWAQQEEMVKKPLDNY
jgi:hypothetical protein